MVHEIQCYANIRNRKEFYSALRIAHGSTYKVPSAVRSADSTCILRCKTLTVLAENHSVILNTHRHTNPNILDEIPVVALMRKMDDDLSLEGIETSMHNNKAAALDGAPAELPKYGSQTVLN